MTHTGPNAPISCPPSSDYDAASKAQADAANPAHPAWVSANAGSGKTKVLIDRVARLLLKGAAPDSILCVTYTKAAANEMLQRLFARLGSWSVMEKDALRVELAALENRQSRSYTDEEILDARALFARALETPGGLRIETIHAFCARILRRFPLEAGVAPGFNEIDEVEADKLWQNVLETGLPEADRRHAEHLNTVALEGGGLGALAGLDAARAHATHLLAFADRCNHDPQQMDAAIRAVLSPPEQSEEDLLANGMGEALPVKALGQAVTLFEADGGKGSQKNAAILRQVFNASTPEKKWGLYRTLFFTSANTLRKSIATKSVLKDPFMAGLFQMEQIPEGSEVARIKQLDADLKAARLYARTRALSLLAAPILQDYRRQKETRAQVDFDDLINKTHALLTQKLASLWVLYKLDGGLTHVLLDEAQDTSPQQWELLKALTAEFFAGKGKDREVSPRTLFVVGDEKQSIYSFQGADPQKFLSERQNFQAMALEAFGKAELPEMAMSFRSSPEILSFVDKVSECGDVDGHPYIAGPVAEANLSRHTARRANQPGCVELWPVEVPEPPKDAVSWQAPRDTEPADSPKNKLAQQVATEVDALLSRGDRVWTENTDRQWHQRPAKAGDILILVNTRTGGLFDAIIDALKAKGIPVAGADRLVLADHIGVQDCLNLIRFVLLPEDDLTLAEILRGPFGNLLDDNLHLFPLAYERGNTSLWERLQKSPQADHKSVADFLSGVLGMRHMPAYELLSHVLNSRTRENGMTGWQKLAARLGPPMRDPVQALLDRAIAHDARDPTSLQNFLAQMELDRSQIKRDLAAAGEDVRVMTVHGAKGLQAPIVILPDTTGAPKVVKPALTDTDDVPVWMGATGDDTPLTALAREDLTKRALRERRRLLYVAMTRAQDRLMIFGAWSGQRPKPDSDKIKDGFHAASWYALCSEAMSDLLGGLPQDDIGRPAFCRFGPAPIAGAADTADSPSHAPLPDWLHTPVPDETSTSRMTAPSALLAGEEPVLPPLGQARAARLKRGRLIHALLERLPALPAADRIAAGQHFLSQDTVLPEEAKEEMLGAAMRVLNDPAFADVFAEGGRAEAPVIGTAPCLPAGMIINGRVDRLVVTDTEILIIDFKTDRPPPHRAEDVALAYLAQMGAYAAVLAEAYPTHRIRAALAWTDGPKLMELPPDLLEKAISQTSLTV